VETHDGLQRSMNAALWQASWGYYLANMIGADGTGLTVEGLAWARDHFLSHVRAAGTFACMRAGRQPYGLLPVTSIDLWQPRAGEEASSARDAWLKSLLLGMRDTFWRTKLGQVARVGQRHQVGQGDFHTARGSFRIARAHPVADFVQQRDQFSAFHGVPSTWRLPACSGRRAARNRRSRLRLPVSWPPPRPAIPG